MKKAMPRASLVFVLSWSGFACSNQVPPDREFNVPFMNGQPLRGIQHKYRETVLFFSSQGQTCHAYCTFCFRWPQFVGSSAARFACRETGELIAYLKQHPEITDVLFTGGDPLIMSARVLAAYVQPLLDADLPQLQRIRFGTKALTYWPYRFITDSDTLELMALFRRILRAGKHLALMAHFNHPREHEPPVVREAIANLRAVETVAPYAFEYHLRRHDGAYRWFDVQGPTAARGKWHHHPLDRDQH